MYLCECVQYMSASCVCMLNAKALHNFLPLASLIYDSRVKQNLLGYAATAMTFADKGVDKTIITWNRLHILTSLKSLS